MHASHLGPNSGCAKRFSPEEMCLLINIYWINWFPICSAVLLRLESCCCYWKCGDYTGGSNITLQSIWKTNSSFCIHQIHSVSTYGRRHGNGIQNLQSIVIFKKPTHALTSATSVGYSRSTEVLIWDQLISWPLTCSNPGYSLHTPLYSLYQTVLATAATTTRLTLTSTTSSPTPFHQCRRGIFGFWLHLAQLPPCSDIIFLMLSISQTLYSSQVSVSWQGPQLLSFLVLQHSSCTSLSV